MSTKIIVRYDSTHHSIRQTAIDWDWCWPNNLSTAVVVFFFFLSWFSILVRATHSLLCWLRGNLRKKQTFYLLTHTKKNRAHKHSVKNRTKTKNVCTKRQRKQRTNSDNRFFFFGSQQFHNSFWLKNNPKIKQNALTANPNNENLHSQQHDTMKIWDSVDFAKSFAMILWWVLFSTNCVTDTKVWTKHNLEIDAEIKQK